VKRIVANGGRLDSEEYLDDRGEVVQRYLISMPLDEADVPARPPEGSDNP
jgi:hypothetical protein